MNKNHPSPTPAHVGVNRSIVLILGVVGKNKKDLAGLLEVAPSGITRRFAAGTWAIDELEIICAAVGAPMTVLFDAESLNRFLSGRTVTTPDREESPTKWFVMA